jgi:hypothetical protein
VIEPLRLFAVEREGLIYRVIEPRVPLPRDWG